MAVTCSCGFTAPEGCACAFRNSSVIGWEKTDTAPNERKPVPILSPQSDNILTCEPGDGLLAAPPDRFITVPHVRVYRSIPFNIGAIKSPQAVEFDTRQYGDSDMWDGADPELITIETSGYYYVFAAVRWEGRSSTGYRTIWLEYSDNTRMAEDLFYVNVAEEFSQCVDTIAPFRSGDFFKVIAEEDHDEILTFPPSDFLQILAANSTTENDRCTAGAVFLGDL